MEWGKPYMLWALTALIIPVLIHLLQLRRYVEVKFSNVSFLDEVDKEAKSHQRLKHLLILLTRLVAVGALVLAFADPFIPFGDDENSEQLAHNIISLYVDNSPSMQAIGENGNLLQTAKANALEIVDQYSETDRFQIITNEFNGSDARYLTKEECAEKIASIKPSAIGRNVDMIISRTIDNISKAHNHNKSIYYLSDLQKSTHDLGEQFTPDTSINIHFIPSFANERPNIWVDSAWFSSPIATVGKQAILNLRLKHNATSEVEGLNMRLDVNGERTAVGTYNIKPGLATDTVMRFSFDNPGDYHAKISIDDSPISFDNTYYLGYEIVSKIRVLQISNDIQSEDATSITRVCKSNDDAIEIENRRVLPDELELQNFDFIISNGLNSPSNGYSNTLAKFVDGGGTVLIIPDTSEINPRAELLMSDLGFGEEYVWDRSGEMNAINSLNVEHPHFDGVFSSTPPKMDLPKSSMALRYKASAEVERLGSNWNGQNFLSKAQHGRGSSFLLGMPLGIKISNLTSHALFVPLVLRMVHTSRKSEANAITLGEENTITLREEFESGAAVRIISTDSASSIIPEIRSVNGVSRLTLGPALTKPGNYKILKDGVQMGTLGVNSNKNESFPKSWDVPSFRDELDSKGWANASVLEVSQNNLATLISNIESGKHLWWYLVLVVLLALTGETVLQKRWKITS